MDNNYIDLLTV